MAHVIYAESLIPTEHPANRWQTQQYKKTKWWEECVCVCVKDASCYINTDTVETLDKARRKKEGCRRKTKAYCEEKTHRHFPWLDPGNFISRVSWSLPLPDTPPLCLPPSLLALIAQASLPLLVSLPCLLLTGPPSLPPSPASSNKEH